MVQRILIDAREFVQGRRTGIGRVLEGLTDTLAESDIVKEIILAVSFDDTTPLRLKNRKKIKIKRIPGGFLKSEKALSDFSNQGFSLFISPYPKLPLFGCHCSAVHTIHDVLDLTHPTYKRRFKIFFDKFRLRTALRKASLTWYDSSWSQEETKKYAGFVGKNPRVRYPALDEKFKVKEQKNEDNILNQYELKPGYILVIGNGLPHKNLGVLLNISDKLSRRIVFIGVSEKIQKYWKSTYPTSKSLWTQYISEEDLPAIMRRSFCLAQPSTAEGYGYPPLEAMACGVPAVVSNIPVLLETTGGNALLAHPGDPKGWMQAFEALENKNIYQNQSVKGLKWVEPLRGRKGWGKHISDIEELIREN